MTLLDQPMTVARAQALHTLGIETPIDGDAMAFQNHLRKWMQNLALDFDLRNL